MKKTELINSLAKELGVSRKLANELGNAIIWAIMKGVKENGEVRIQGFGILKKFKRYARTGINPQDPKKTVKIPAMNLVTFKAESKFKSILK